MRKQYRPVADVGQEIVARAMSLCPQFSSTSERREILTKYWPFFRDDKHFANWCQLGFSFPDGMKAAMLANYTRTLISDVARLREGNCLQNFNVEFVNISLQFHKVCWNEIIINYWTFQPLLYLVD